MAAGITNLILVILNAMTTCLGGGIAGFGAWLATKEPQSLQYMHVYILLFGCLMMALSVAAMVAAFFQVSLLLRVYLLLVLLVAGALLVFALFTFIITHKSTARILSKIGYKQYRITDFSNWLQEQVDDPAKWSRIRACLRDSKMCFFGYLSTTQLLARAVDYLAADTYKSCCGPPSACQYSQDGPMYSNPQNSGADFDCTTFDNDPNYRCFDCNSCPIGVFQDISKNWKKIAIGLVAIAGFLFIIYSLGCQAF